jgi:glyoxylase-like metal-dependent hydrolase (beta-lactamase superfamily II)
LVGGYIVTDYTVPLTDDTKYNLTTFCFVLIHEEYGPMMFDTGSPTQRDRVIKQLKETFKLNLEDIRWVFNTHLHIDHVGLNFILPRANMIFSKKEYMFTRRMVEAAFSHNNFFEFMLEEYPGYRGNFTQKNADTIKSQIIEHWPGDKTIAGLNIRYIEDSPEIPAFVSVIPTYGHTFAHYSFKITTPVIDFYITGDALSNRLEYTYMDEEPFEPQADKELFAQSKEALHKLEGIIVPGHDRPFYTKTMKSLRKTHFEIDHQLIPG